MEKIRLQKYISECGVMSRRAAEKEILAGNITVNGEAVELGRTIDERRDKVMYNGKPVVREKRERKVYIMLNKPKGYVTTMSDERGRRCVASLVEDVGCRVYPVGRLDLMSEGLLIMTNDGELANKLMHPRHSIPKIYHVRIDSELTPEQFVALSSEMVIDDYKIMPVECRIVTMAEGKTTIAMTLYEGRNRQIRKMCEQVGLKVLKLRRVAIGEIKLGDLRPGKWRKLTRAQVEYLKSGKEGKK